MRVYGRIREAGSNKRNGAARFSGPETPGASCGRIAAHPKHSIPRCMSVSQSLEFIISDEDARRIPQLPKEAFHLRPVGRHSFQRSYHDSFDWRLHRAGLEWVVEELNGRLTAAGGPRGGGSFDPVEIAEPPRFAHQWPNPKWRCRLTEALGVRAVLPRVELRGERAEWVLEDEEGTAMADLMLETFFVDRLGTSATLPMRLHLTPRKGFRKACRSVQKRLTDEFRLAPAGTSVFSDALEALGLLPENSSALLRTELEPELRADAAVKEVLRSLLETLRLNEAGVKAELDTEFLHDFRVAVRRTRSALGQIRKVFPDRVVQRFTSGFAELGRVSGEARDLDVYLLAFDCDAEKLSEPLQGALDPLRELLRQRAREAHARLNRFLESAAYGRLVRNWSVFLDMPPPRRPRAAKALLPVRVIADRRIWKLYRRVLEQGEAIVPESPAEQVHALRKTAKKLRYLMEFFRSLYPREKIEPLVKILKGLQDHLGEYQDVHVQIASLRDFAAELREAGVPIEALLAVGALLDRLHRREKILREGFAERFAEFAESGHQRKFKSLVRSAETRADSSQASND